MGLFKKFFMLNLFSSITLAAKANTLQRVIEYSLKDVYTPCYMTNTESNTLTKYWMANAVPFLTIDPRKQSEVTKLCDGYILHLKNVTEFSKALSTFTFLAHKKILLFLEKIFSSKHLEEQIIYEKALSLVVVDDFERANENSTYTLTFVLEDKVKILGRDKIAEKDFDNTWSPELFWLKLGRKIHVSLFHCPPFIAATKEDELDGIDFNIFKTVAKRWKVRFLIEKEEDNIRSNFFVKIIDRVVLKQSDIAICGLWQRVLLERSVDFSKYNSVDCVTYLVARPRLLRDATFIFQPFDDALWLAIFVIFGVMFLLTKVVMYGTGLKKCSIPAIVTFSYFSIGPSVPKTALKSVKILFQFWSVFCLLTLIYYSAGLTRSLRFPKFSRDINTFEDMVKYKIRWEEPLPDIQKWLLNTNHTLYQNLGKLFFFGKDKAAMNRRLCTQNYALLVKIVDKGYLMNAEDLDEYGRNNMKVIPQCFANFYTVFAFQQNSPFTKIFDKEMPKFVEHGFVHYWQKLYVGAQDLRYMRNFFEGLSSEVRQKIDFSKLQGGFCLLIFGYVTAVIVFTLECTLHRK